MTDKIILKPTKSIVDYTNKFFEVQLWIMQGIKDFDLKKKEHFFKWQPCELPTNSHYTQPVYKYIGYNNSLNTKDCTIYLSDKKDILDENKGSIIAIIEPGISEFYERSFDQYYIHLENKYEYNPNVKDESNRWMIISNQYNLFLDCEKAAKLVELLHNQCREITQQYIEYRLNRILNKIYQEENKESERQKRLYKGYINHDEIDYDDEDFD